MRRMGFIPLLGVAATIALAPPLYADAVPFEIDPAHSQVGFNIRHFFTRVNGRFNEFTLNLQLDEKSLANSSVTAEIKAASIFTNQERRDKDLRSSNFFSVDSFPKLTFKSTKVIPGEGGKLKIEGNLTIKSVTKPVVLDATFLGAGQVTVEGGYNVGYRAGFEATTTINRKDFGIVWNRALDQGGTMLGDDVTITIGIEAVRVEPGKGNVGKKE